ncbi:tyrosine-type recombinase/integrase [Bradyrhizobium sp. 215_C5_N1_1]|uniref:tyrosine-type recombinase/integrase n=1 Tax=unclassified Bradyrhizobium TaxID=2631580 RepID=UPI003F88F248
MTKRLPRYVSEFPDRHGKMRVRARRKGQESYYFKAAPWTPEFMAEYHAFLDRAPAPIVGPGSKRIKPGSISALIAAYYLSPEFKGCAESTKATFRGILERFRNEHGEKRVATIQRQHIKAIIGSKSDTPSAANNLLDRLRTLMGFAIDIGLRKDDPTFRVKGFKIRNDGFHTWTEGEILAFETRHPLGSKARLAFALMLYTGQRRSDAVVMGWQHVEATKIKVRQIKTSKRLSIKIHPSLAAVLEKTPRSNLTFLVTQYGKPFSAAGFGNWFRDRCDEAGLPQCSAHGLRKAAARRLAEVGCSNQQIKAVTGHVTDKEVARYTAAANQERLAEQAIDASPGGEREQKLSNQNVGLDKTSLKPLKRKGR